MATSSVGDWSNMLKEILTSIARRLSVVDYANFSAVCTSWAFVASPENGMPPPLSLDNIPYLLLPGDDGEQSESCNLLDVFTNSCHRVDPLPEIRGKWCVGSQFGWLALVDELSNPSLLNPLTRSRLELPPISTHADVEPVYNPDGSILEYIYRHAYHTQQPDADVSPWDLHSFRSNAIFKLVLSSSPINGDFSAMARMGIYGNLIYTRPGDNKWTSLDMYRLDDHLGGAVRDILHRDGKFLVLSHFGSIQEVDLTGPSIGIKTIRAITQGFQPQCENTYLVESDGDLLLICREVKRIKIRQRRKPKHMFKTFNFDVYKLNNETTDWYPVTTLGDKSLFLGASYSVAISVQEIARMKPNCIYYTDDYWDQLPYEKEMVRDVGVYSLDDGSFEVTHPPNPQMNWPPPIWITPFLQ